jgi:hypothetical protein
VTLATVFEWLWVVQGSPVQWDVKRGHATLEGIVDGIVGHLFGHAGGWFAIILLHLHIIPQVVTRILYYIE